MSVVKSSERRDCGYLRVGRHVVDACELLIVVWDGQPDGYRWNG